ncbi:MAG: DUF2335 domain-containing protein [Spirochaetia bacterium]|nr:DUF2335 domain-containing protein [Spirochaetia bacterium]
MEISLSERHGILPPADELERLEHLHSGITERLLSSYEKQVAHRMELEKAVIFSGIKRARNGQIIACCLCLLCIIGGFALVFNGKDAGGFGVIIGAAATMIGAFIYGMNSNRKERIQKSQANPEQ